ncbi:MAG: lamin tail domain-containing protein, partial [bacterium]|nr:lamin tail domain-containing protein [bacterium]
VRLPRPATARLAMTSVRRFYIKLESLSEMKGFLREKAIFLVFFLLFLFGSGFSSPVLAYGNLLLNFDFEATQSGAPVNWTKSPSTATLIASSSATHSGNFSLGVHKKEASGSAYAYQEVIATPSALYAFSGWILWNNSDIKYAKLRLNWLDAGGKNLKKSPDEAVLEASSSSFQKLILEETAPVGTVKVRADAYVYQTKKTETPAYFDDFILEQTIFCQNDISLSEYLPDPSSGEEWAELYNSGEKCNLGGWKIDDIEEGSSAVNIATTSGMINAGEYKIFDLGTKLNNTGDSVRLIKPDNSVLETTSFTSSTKGYSFAKNSSGVWQETTTTTPGLANQISAPPTPTPTPSTSSSSSSSSSSSNNSPKIEFSFPDEVSAGEVFPVTISVNEGGGEIEYYLKIRIGSGSKFSDGKTLNGSAWLSDSSKWSLFPLFSADNRGFFAANLGAKVEKAGDYQIQIRARDKDEKDNFDSEKKTLKVKEKQKPLVLALETKTASTAGSPAVLGEAIVNLAANSLPPEMEEEKEEQIVVEENPKNNGGFLEKLISLAVGGFGLALIISAGKRILRKGNSSRF